MRNPLLFIKFLFKSGGRWFCPIHQSYLKLFRMNLKQWLLYHQKNIHLSECYWMGVRAFKNPFDAWIYQEIIYEVKPDIILELGSAEGGSTLYLANCLDLIGKGNVVSVDIDRSKFNVKHPRILTVTGNSSSMGTVQKVSELCRGQMTLVIHDADHRKKQVLEDLRNYSKLVSVNSYFIVEDGIVDLLDFGDEMWKVESGPLAAVKVFLQNNPDFVVDKKRERYLLTYNPHGFLKRIR